MIGSVDVTPRAATLLQPAGAGRMILGLLCLLAFLGALDQNVIVTALPSMLGDTKTPIVLLNAGRAPAIQFDRAAWLVTGYLLGYVAVLPLMGAVSDVHGRRRSFQVALLVFAAGSVIAARAGTLPELVLARIGQALGAGALLPIALAAAADLTSAERQGRTLGLIVAAAEVGGVCGPLYGAFITQQSELGWRLIFWLNVPIVAALLPITVLLPAVGSPRPVDYRGGAILGLALAALVAGTSSSGIFGTAGGGAANRLFLPLSAALLVLWWRLERDLPTPLLPLDLLQRPRFVAACAANALVGVALGVAMVVVPLYAATVLADSALDGGLLLLRYLVMLVCGAALGGWLRDRYGARPVAIAGLALAAAGYWLLRGWLVSPPHTPSWFPPMLAGLGIGLVAAPIATTALQAAGREQGGVLASMVTAARVIGMMVGLSSLTSYGSWRFHTLAAGMRVPPVPSNGGLAGLQRVLTAYSDALQGKEILVLREIFAGAGFCCLLALLPALLFAAAGEPALDR
jgi:MFS family permease